MSHFGQWVVNRWMVSLNCQHVTTENHLERKSQLRNYPGQVGQWTCPHRTVLTIEPPELLTLKKADWESKQVALMCLILSAVDYGGDLISCSIFHLDFLHNRPWPGTVVWCVHLVEFAFLHLDNCHEKNIPSDPAYLRKIHSKLELSPPGDKFSCYKPQPTSRHVSLKKIIAVICLWVWNGLLYSSWLIHTHSLIKLAREVKGGQI